MREYWQKYSRNLGAGDKKDGVGQAKKPIQEHGSDFLAVFGCNINGFEIGFKTGKFAAKALN